jgi:hypothetical protein
MNPMHFEDALYNLKLGKPVCRSGWNGKGMHIFLVPDAAAQVPHKYGGGYHVQAAIWMKTVDDTIVPWLCSQTDLLATDWEILESPARADQKHISHA